MFMNLGFETDFQKKDILKILNLAEYNFLKTIYHLILKSIIILKVYCKF